MPLWLTAAGAVCILVVARCAARQKHALAAVLGGALICLGLAMLCVLLFMWAGSALKSLMNAYRSRRQH